MDREIAFLTDRYLKMIRTDQLTILGVVDGQARKAELAFIGKPSGGEDQISSGRAGIPEKIN